MVFFLSCFRITFLAYHFPDYQIPTNSFLYSLFNGIRFDLSTMGYLLLPVWIIYFIFSLPIFSKSIIDKISILIKFYLIFFCIICTIIFIVDIGFFAEFDTRINYLTFEYFAFMDHTIITIISSFPYNLLALIILILIVLQTIFLWKKIPNIIISKKPYSYWMKSLFISSIILVFILRGGIQSKPLNWTNSCITPFRFTNQLVLNPIWSLGFSLVSSNKENFQEYFNSIDLSIDESNQIARKSVQINNGNFLNKNFPVLRKTISKNKKNNYNVVIILMESFAGEYIGKLGNKQGITPYFDKLSNEGILFTRMFSTGSRTNRGLSGTLLSFPAVPRLKSIMQDGSVNQKFSSLASILKRRGYETYYLFGGDMNYDNQYGFLSGQGYDNFISREHFGNDVFSTVWGVADEYLFDKSLEILKKQNKPTLMTILTISNHPTYAFPIPNNFEMIPKEIDNSIRLNAFKYSDWALGKFMKECEKSGLYDNTIFVILGDHGFNSKLHNQNISLNIGSYYIPCLIITPERKKAINNRIASQIDIIPSLLDLLGDTFVHNSWGKNLFNKNNSEDFAIFAPSGLNHIMGMITEKYYYIHNLDNNNLNELYSISKGPEKMHLQKINNFQSITNNLDKILLGYTKASYNALISYKCGLEY